LTRCYWEDLTQPYAAWKGLWSARHRTYHTQPPAGPRQATAACHDMLERLKEMAAPPPPSHW
ncbi:hypothetical protein OV450_8534, partial [Actinobacteria bacterium OV450]